MGNRLFQEARDSVEQALAYATEENIAVAKNNLSSAFANANLAEQRQLSGMQKKLQQAEQSVRL
ncbi:DUF3813 domain-containing protein [Bacillus thermotolerans]|uniref:DUF3813 domain-containing protein n=1 Tax=Bacillus thermotolerans TaxID=1221996 RepID=A0A0F5HSB5_BACTR|nr:DUF3813 domain-containing protein [Bacillus thermotolerans]KKB33176.1 hypothetical protein QY97_03826 [Bacillus thermotolerans]KKB36259.1 hypothetical protein QY95_03123 [Bacillus thermotolerans]KKB44798.1 hypothetical protein QY96_01079 [Bacillus thermotolerans]